MKKPSFLSLFWKFTIAIVVIVALFGFINLFFINNTIYTLFEKALTMQKVLQTIVSVLFYTMILQAWIRWFPIK